MTGMHTQLNAPPADTSGFSIVTSVNAWINAGLSRSKTVMGIAAYGHSWTLSNPSVRGVGAPASGTGLPGQWSQEPGSLFQYEIDAEVGSVVQDATTACVYKVFRTNQWVGYDNAATISIKVQWAKTNGLGGYMLWAIDTDNDDQIAKAATAAFG